MLWAHLREPESAFARLPLELVVYIMRHLNAPGGLNALPEGITIDPVCEFTPVPCARNVAHTTHTALAGRN
jgi:hypothetical protein